MRFIEAIAARDEAGQHAGIGSMHLAGDQRKPHAGQRLHTEPAQHLHMGMARAYEHDVLDDGLGVRLHGDVLASDGAVVGKVGSGGMSMWR
jgi:hypothetical protein